jgi:pseudouridine 5'-phosphatase
MSGLPPSGLPRIKACLFDMDGLLINSEDIYTLCTNLMLHEYGRPSLPWNIKARLQGRPGPESHRIFQEWAQLPVSTDVFFAKMRTYQEQHFLKTAPLPGVEDLLKNLASTKGDSEVEMAVATSSNTRNFEIKTAHLQHLFDVFSKEKIVLGDDARIAENRGKPAPDIYLLALQVINESRKAQDPKAEDIHPEECLVFEDSVPGVEAGIRAGMQVAWIPHEGLLGEYKGRERHVLAGQTGEHVEEEHDDGEKIDWAAKRDKWVESGRTHARVRGKPGDLDDGWATFYDSLEGFPYEYYGIKI